MDADGDEEWSAALNRDLSNLATTFPGILPEVLRELLITFDGESRLYLAAEQLLKNEDRWVRGRWRPRIAIARAGHGQQPIAVEDEFRKASYIQATRKLLCEEFKVLNRSKIAAVLAEENFCYSRARLTLQELANKSWRTALNSLISKWRKPAGTGSKDHYTLRWLRGENDEQKLIPVLRHTGDNELDLELHNHVLGPLMDILQKEQEAEDSKIAIAINEAEAQDMGAIYECECCYSDTTFEQAAFCSTKGHLICFQCIWHAVREALFGQSWGSNIEHNCGQVKCLALVSEGSCEGCMPTILTTRAVLQAQGGSEALKRLEARLTEEAVLESNLAVVHCPFCPYVEADELYFPPATVQYRLKTNHLQLTILLLTGMFTIAPFLLIYNLMSCFPPFQALPRLARMISKSLAHLSRSHHLNQRFQCRSPECGLQSCLSCLKAWYDPHICHESATLSLRTTVEAAQTTALKRTCPRCGLGFIKDSGCNKLTCVCGYTLCYICRQGLGSGGGGEAYRHFCQHFRSAGGACKECNKCDLYRNEDDDRLVNKAGVLAEKEWRERSGIVGVKDIISGQKEMTVKTWWENTWTVQGLLDCWVENVLTC